MHKYPLAYLIEGEFESYFKDKPIPTKETDDKKKDSKKNKVNKNKIENVVTEGTKINKGRGKIFFNWFIRYFDRFSSRYTRRYSQFHICNEHNRCFK